MKTIHTLKKVSLATFLTFVLSFSSVFAQNDTMYIMKSGAIAGQYNVNTEVDSVIFYKPTVAQNDTEGTFTDSRDGNEYNWVQIGTQTWMAENLKYLPSVVGPGTGSQTTPHYYVHGYNGTDVNAAKATTNYATYGVLYNWTAALTACPAGWHLPSDAEWTELTDYLGGQSVAGGKLKETGTTHWISPNTGATNGTGFTALPGGARYDSGTFSSIGSYGGWWSATEYDASNAWNRGMNYDTSKVYRYSGNKKEVGHCVRCVRD